MLWHDSLSLVAKKLYLSKQIDLQKFSFSIIIQYLPSWKSIKNELHSRLVQCILLPFQNIYFLNQVNKCSYVLLTSPNKVLMKCLTNVAEEVQSPDHDERWRAYELIPFDYFGKKLHLRNLGKTLWTNLRN